MYLFCCDFLGENGLETNFSPVIAISKEKHGVVNKNLMINRIARPLEEALVLCGYLQILLA